MPKTKEKEVEKKVKKEDSIKQQQQKLTLEIKINEETSIIKGDDVFEMLESFVAPDFIKTRTEVTLKSKEGTSFMILQIPQARRVFNNNTSKELLASDLIKRIR